MTTAKMSLAVQASMHLSILSVTKPLNDFTSVYATQQIANDTPWACDQLQAASIGPPMDNTSNPSMIIQAEATSSTLALHSSGFCLPVDLVAIQLKIWSNMQALAQLFPDVVDYYNTDLPLEVNDNLQPAYKTMQTSQQHTQTLAAVTTTSSSITQSQLHLTMSDDGHPVKTDSLSRDPPSIDSCGALTHNTIQKLNNLTNHILWMTEQMALLIHQLTLVHNHLLY